MESASLVFQSSRQGSALLVDAITRHEEVHLTDHLAHLDAVHSGVTKDREDQFRLLLSSLLPGLPSLTSHAVQRAVDFHTSGWLNVLPLATIILICLHSNSVMLFVCDIIAHCL